MRHIHADHMIAAANDTSIEWQAMGPLSREWIYTGKSGEFMFYPDSQYRQKPTPHPHQAMIDQAEADPSIVWQIKYLKGGLEGWEDCYGKAHFQVNCYYRQKPKMVDLWQWAVRRKSDGDIWATTDFFATKEDAQYHSSSKIICRIEGSKITVPEVSQ